MCCCFRQKVGINNTNPQNHIDRVYQWSIEDTHCCLSPIGNQIILPNSVGYLVVNSADAFFNYWG